MTSRFCLGGNAVFCSWMAIGFPGGVLQVRNVVQHGYWHARSLAYTGSDTARLIEWLRLPGDLVSIVFGAPPLAIASIKRYMGVRVAATGTDSAG
jgi:nitric oxide reductase subunit B